MGGRTRRLRNAARRGATAPTPVAPVAAAAPATTTKKTTKKSTKKA